MPAVLPFLPIIAGVGGAIASNVQQKSANANIDNKNAAAQQQDTAAQQIAFQQNQQAIQAALGRAQQYDASNPNPVNSYGPIQGPPQFGAGATLGGGQAGPTGIAGAIAPPSLATQQGGGMDISALIKAMMAGQGGAATPPAAPLASVPQRPRMQRML